MLKNLEIFNISDLFRIKNREIKVKGEKRGGGRAGGLTPHFLP